MSRNLKRMLAAFVISASGYAFAHIWFIRGQSAGPEGTKTQIATLSEISNEVQRKPVQRVIWETVGKNDELFAGEAVRTAANAEAQIQILKNGTTIRLEPDSLIVLEENENGLRLDFLQGNMMVAGGDANLTVKTGSGEIKLNSADISLSKDTSGDVSLEVLKGQAELKQGQQKVEVSQQKAAVLSEKGVSTKDRFMVLAPQANDSLLLNLMKSEKAAVQWQALPKGYNVSVDVGPSRTQWTRVGVAAAPGETGQVDFQIRPGRWFLRVKADTQDPALTKLAPVVIPITVLAKAPPSLIEPSDKAAQFKKSPDELTQFRWMNRHAFTSQVLEVASDPQFKTVSFRKDLGPDEKSAASNVADGDYYWRVTGFLKTGDKSEALSSPPRSFRLNSSWQLNAPTLLSPSNQQRLSYLEVQKTKGLNLKWQQPPGVKRFHVTVQLQTENGGKTLIDETSESTLARVVDPVPGVYLWKVASLDDKNDEEKVSETFEFVIDELPPIEWVETNLNHDHEYTTPTPSLRAQWKPVNPPPAGYRYRVVADGLNIQEGKWATTKQNIFDISLPAEGVYQASVEAVNGAGQAIAASAVRSFTIRPRPLLPAPKWADNIPETLKSDARGNLSFGWQQVDGAKNYLMILESDEGQVVEQRTVNRNTASLSKLKPGQYQVKLKSVDEHQRPGPEGEVKKLTVPNMSDIRAPKIKTMKVK